MREESGVQELKNPDTFAVRHTALPLCSNNNLFVRTRENPSVSQQSSCTLSSWSEESQKGTEEIFVVLQDSYLSFSTSDTSLPFDICSPGDTSSRLQHHQLQIAAFISLHRT